MNSLNQYITEKLHLNKGRQVVMPKDADYLSDYELTLEIEKNIPNLSFGEGKIFMDKAFPFIDFKKYQYLYIDPKIYGTKWAYEFQLEEAAEWIKDKKNIDDNCMEHRYTNHTLDLSIYHYINVNLSDDDGDEHYVYIMDYMHHNFFIYQFIKDGETWIKEFD